MFKTLKEAMDSVAAANQELRLTFFWANREYPCFIVFEEETGRRATGYKVSKWLKCASGGIPRDYEVLYTSPTSELARQVLEEVKRHYSRLERRLPSPATKAKAKRPKNGDRDQAKQSAAD